MFLMTLTPALFNSVSTIEDTAGRHPPQEVPAFVQDVELWLLVSGAGGDPEDFFSAAKGQAWLRLKAHF